MYSNDSYFNPIPEPEPMHSLRRLVNGFAQHIGHLTHAFTRMDNNPEAFMRNHCICGRGEHEAVHMNVDAIVRALGLTEFWEAAIVGAMPHHEATEVSDGSAGDSGDRADCAGTSEEDRPDDWDRAGSGPDRDRVGVRGSGQSIEEAAKNFIKAVTTELFK